MPNKRRTHYFDDLERYSKAELLDFLDAANTFRDENSAAQRKSRFADRLSGKCIAGAFFENSTRTRLAFEMAVHALGGKFINLDTAVSSMAKGESIRDTLLTVEALGVDALVIRHKSAGIVHFVRKLLDLPLVNAGDGSHAHPTQTLADLLTLRARIGEISGRRVALVGDFLHSRVAHSFALALTKLGADVHVAAPANMLPARGLRADFRLAPFSALSWHTRVVDALEGAHAVMAIRVHRERHTGGSSLTLSSYARHYALKPHHLQLMLGEPVVLHCGPVNEGIDLSADVLNSPHCAVQEQVRNGIWARMAVLSYVCNGGLI